MRTKTRRKAVQEAADPEHCAHPEVHQRSARGIRCTVCKVCFKLLDEGPLQPSNLEGELKKAPLHQREAGERMLSDAKIFTKDQTTRIFRLCHEMTSRSDEEQYSQADLIARVQDIADAVVIQAARRL